MAGGNPAAWQGSGAASFTIFVRFLTLPARLVEGAGWQSFSNCSWPLGATSLVLFKGACVDFTAAVSLTSMA